MKPYLKPLLLGLGALILISGSSFAMAARWYGSSAAAWDALRGRSLHIERSVISIGDVKMGTRLPLTFKVINLTGRSVRLLGSSSSCGCFVPPQMPMTIAPSATADVHVILRSSSQPLEGFIQKVQVYTSLPEEALLEFTIVGNIRSGNDQGAMGK